MSVRASLEASAGKDVILDDVAELLHMLLLSEPTKSRPTHYRSSRSG